MSKLSKLKQAQTLSDFAELLERSPQRLAFLLYKIPIESKYHTFFIKKRSGGYRKIDAPNNNIKWLQKDLSDLLYACLTEIRSKDAATSSADPTTPRRDSRAISHGYEKGLSIFSNADKHLGKRHVLNFDIENFFPSINFGRVRGFFIKDKNFSLTPKVATIIAQIACYNNALPQGSPCSPVISNLIGHILDIRLVRIAKKNGCVYTRYVDDITFSTNQKIFPTSIATQESQASGKWVISSTLLKELKSLGFKANAQKTRMQYRPSRQMVTGLVVNKYVNVRSEYYRTVRSMCHSLFTTGQYQLFTQKEKKRPESHWKRAITTILKVIAKIINNAKICDPLNSPDEKDIYATPVNTPSLARLQGILNFIYFTKEYRNKFVMRPTLPFYMADGFHESKKPSKNRFSKYEDSCHTKQNEGIRQLFAYFLYYKHFYALEAPLLVCEGKTDLIYIKCALKHLTGQYPSLIESTKDGLKFKISFFNKRGSVENVMRLPTDGLATTKTLLQHYPKIMRRFSAPGKKHPVICIADNDDEGRRLSSLINAAKKHDAKPSTSITPTPDNFGDAPFYHVTQNLYVVSMKRTPQTDIEIEDLFDPSLLATRLGSKTFSRSNDPTHNQYGKVDFAKKVVLAKQDHINFDGFKPLLDRIMEVIDDYNSRIPHKS